MTRRVLVAGLGNIFLADDGFGVEVARRLAEEPLPDCVQVTDFGIGGVHLAYELLEGYETAILVDAMPRGEEPGTVYVIEAEPGGDVATTEPTLVPAAAISDAHAMEPGSVLAMIEALGVSTRVLVVGCEPAELEEHIGLSPVVAQAVDGAVPLVRALLEEEAGPMGSVPVASNVPSSHSKREES